MCPRKSERGQCDPEIDVLRVQRKREHLVAAAAVPDGPGSTWLECVRLVPDSLPEFGPDDVRLDVTVAGLELVSPLIINAITGGTEEAGRINVALARTACRLGLAMAVGSQRVAVANPDCVPTFTIVREAYPRGPLFANVGLDASPDEARRAVTMIDADALQVHLNAAQELAMSEGDRTFGGLNNVRAIIERADVPVIAKEVGFGISGRDAVRLISAGAAAVDVGGQGGTNFVAVEASRDPGGGRLRAFEWGIPTAACVVECSQSLGDPSAVIASGGVRSGFDAARALALGAGAVGIAGPLVRVLASGGEEALVRYLEQIVSELRDIMVLVGARTVGELRRVPAVILSPLRDWLEMRGFAAADYARR